MKFLDDCEPNRASVSSYDDEISNEIVDPNSLVQPSSDLPSSGLPPSVLPSPVQPTNLPTKPVKSSRSSAQSKSKTVSDEVVEECLGVLRSVNNSEVDQTRDRCDCYAQYVAASLKTMNSWNQTLAMAEMTSVLIKYDPNNPA